MLDTKKI